MMDAGQETDACAETLNGVGILVVDDEDMPRRAMARVLARAGATVVQAANGTEAIAALGNPSFDAVLCDVRMPGLDGMAILRAVRERDLDVAVILITGAPDIRSAVQAVKLGAFDYLGKPYESSGLKEVVRRAATTARLARAKRQAMASVGRDATEAGDRASLELAFDRALKTLWMAYQPIVDRDGNLYGFEALMRTREPTLPHPGAVLDAAERLGRLQELGRRTRDLAGSDVAELDRSVALFLNLHSSDLEDESLWSKDSAFAKLGPRVVLEVTERASLDRVRDARASVSFLRDRGFRIAVDDLGAGYAGLTAFTQLEPDIAKLDMSIVRDVDRDDRRGRIIRAMTTLCHDLEVLVVAEGVETIAERDVLLDLGCDLFQGYLIAKPAPPFPGLKWPLRGN